MRNKIRYCLSGLRCPPHKYHFAKNKYSLSGTRCPYYKQIIQNCIHYNLYSIKSNCTLQIKLQSKLMKILCVGGEGVAFLLSGRFSQVMTCRFKTTLDCNAFKCEVCTASSAWKTDVTS